MRVHACGVCGTDLLKLYSPAIAKPIQLGHEALELLRRPDFALERLVTHQLPLEQIDEGMRLARAEQAIKVLLRPGQEPDRLR